MKTAHAETLPIESQTQSHLHGAVTSATLQDEIIPPPERPRRYAGRSAADWVFLSSASPQGHQLPK